MRLLKLKYSKTVDNFIHRCESIGRKNYYSNVYALSRTLLAIGTLITLLFNSEAILFQEEVFNSFTNDHFLKNINLFHLFSFENLYIPKLISILILLTVISGILPRITGVLHWWVSFSFFHSALIIDGGDQVTSVITLFLIPITLLDSRKNHWHRKEVNNIYKNFTAFLIFLIIELQVAIIYLQAGIEKPFKVEEWADGTAVYYWLNHNVFGGSDLLLSFMNPLMDYPIFISALTWGTIIFEILLFGLFFTSREKRYKLLKFAILFHFIIILFHGLVSFFFAMSAALILYLTPKDKWLYISKKYNIFDSLSSLLKKINTSILRRETNSI